GRDVNFVGRAAQTKLDRLPDLTAELLRSGPDAIVAVGATGALTVKKATAEVPVFVVVLDPVASGLAATMQRPGGNVTGITNFDPQQGLKQLELLKPEVLKRANRVIE